MKFISLIAHDLEWFEKKFSSYENISIFLSFGGRSVKIAKCFRWLDCEWKITMASLKVTIYVTQKLRAPFLCHVFLL